MNAKNKNNKPERSKLLEILTTEYKGESLILGIFATLTAALAILIISGADGFIIPPDFPILGGKPNDMIFAWTVLIIALLGMALVIYPFFLPAIPELKKITWATKLQMLDHTVRVLIFIVILTLFIAGIDVIILRVIKALS